MDRGPMDLLSGTQSIEYHWISKSVVYYPNLSSTHEVCAPDVGQRSSSLT